MKAILERRYLYEVKLYPLICPRCESKRSAVILGETFLQLNPFVSSLPEDTLWIDWWDSRSSTGKSFTRVYGGESVTVHYTSQSTPPRKQRALFLTRGTKLKIYPSSWMPFLPETSGCEIEEFADPGEPSFYLRGFSNQNAYTVVATTEPIHDLSHVTSRAQSLCTRCLEREAAKWPIRQGHLRIIKAEDASEEARRRYATPGMALKGVAHRSPYKFFNHEIQFNPPELYYIKTQEDNRRASIAVIDNVTATITSPDHPDETVTLGPGTYFLYHPWPQRD